eukprot:366099-Chlamydomonas_euryale.AAC.10
MFAAALMLDGRDSGTDRAGGCAAPGCAGGGATRAERSARVDEVLEMLGLSGAAHTMVGAGDARFVGCRPHNGGCWRCWVCWVPPTQWCGCWRYTGCRLAAHIRVGAGGA